MAAACSRHSLACCVSAWAPASALRARLSAARPPLLCAPAPALHRRAVKPRPPQTHAAAQTWPPAPPTSRSCQHLAQQTARRVRHTKRLARRKAAAWACWAACRRSGESWCTHTWRRRWAQAAAATRAQRTRALESWRCCTVRPALVVLWPCLCIACLPLHSAVDVSAAAVSVRACVRAAMWQPWLRGGPASHALTAPAAAAATCPLDGPTGKPRAATVVAQTAGVLWKLSRDDFRAALQVCAATPAGHVSCVLAPELCMRGAVREEALLACQCPLQRSQRAPPGACLPSALAAVAAGDMQARCRSPLPPCCSRALPWPLPLRQSGRGDAGALVLRTLRSCEVLECLTMGQLILLAGLLKPVGRQIECAQCRAGPASAPCTRRMRRWPLLLPAFTPHCAVAAAHCIIHSSRLHQHTAAARPSIVTATSSAARVT